MAPSRKAPVLIGAVLVFVVASILFFILRDGDSPSIQVSHLAESISPALPVTVVVTDEHSPIKNVSVVVRYQKNEIPLVNQSFTNGAKEQELTFTLAKSGLKHDEAFEIEIRATDDSFGGVGTGNTAKQTLALKLDALPPRVSLKTTPPNIRKGGAGCVVYSIGKEVQQTGISVGKLFFPAFRQENGSYLCFFAFPYNMELKDFNPKLVALDIAGNMANIDLPVTRIERQFKHDTINISQGFLNAKAAEFAQMAPGDMSEVERFLQVNGAIRKQNALDLLEIGKKTANEMLWRGAFIRLPRAANRAGFADHRTYVWEGQTVDKQTHLGFDLASVKHAPIPASNSGTVVFADYLGIYGNLVIIDHGLGLQSLYSHLSEIEVSEGAIIKKGDVIGKTGVTGMAGGDHLHFGILIGGLEVTPLEWLDAKWIKDNIVDRVVETGIKLPQFVVPVEEPAAPSRNTRRR